MAEALSEAEIAQMRSDPYSWAVEVERWLATIDQLQAEIERLEGAAIQAGADHINAAGRANGLEATLDRVFKLPERWRAQVAVSGPKNPFVVLLLQAINDLELELRGE